jgi:hypothetical protein
LFLFAEGRPPLKMFWQTDWNENVNNKLHGISPIVSEIESAILKRRVAVLLDVKYDFRG